MGDLGELGLDLSRFAGEVEQAGRELMAEALEAGLELARDYSSAPPLAPGEHPFAKSRGAPAEDPSIIHLGSGPTQGNFAGAWQGELENDGMTLHLWNDDPAAQFLEADTERMFARPIGERLEAEIGADVERKAGELLARLK